MTSVIIFNSFECLFEKNTVENYSQYICQYIYQYDYEIRDVERESYSLLLSLYFPELFSQMDTLSCRIQI